MLGPRSNPGDSPNYNNQAFFCFGETSAQNVLTPRARLGSFANGQTFGLELHHTPAALQGFALKLDVFNVTNAQTAQNVVEAYNNSSTRMSATYERVISYTAPRSARLTAEYNKKF